MLKSDLLIQSNQKDRKWFTRQETLNLFGIGESGNVP